MEKRYLSLWFPYLATDHVHRRGLVDRDQPFVLTREDHGRSIIVAANPKARREGMAVEMPLAMARAICGDLVHGEEDVAETARLLEKMADWCDRFSPLVALDAPDGLMLDVSGCAHLYGGKEAFMETVRLSLKGQGFLVCAAMAPTPGAARAIARYGRNGMILGREGMKAALAALPVTALNQDRTATESLMTVGLVTLGHLYEIPRAALANRYGMGPALALDKMLGDLPDPISPRPHKSPYAARLAFPDPVGRAEDIHQAVLDLLSEVCQRLEDDRLGARQFCLRILKTDNGEQHFLVGTGAPARDPRHIMRLFEEKLTLVEPGFGIDCFLLSVSRMEPMAASQAPMGSALTAPGEKGKTRAGAELIELADRLRNRLGAGAVYGLEPRNSHLPDRAQALGVGIGARLAREALPKGGWPQQTARPVRLISPAEPVVLLSLAGEDQAMIRPGETAFRWRGRIRRVMKLAGPERIAPDWWQDRAGWRGARDYYRVEDDTGARYWLYREGGRAGQTRWFLQGLFR
ncbi:DNA polymerase Y family protein [Aestuariispira insulae]|uniref:DNA-directed DNA polymerase n=1 Tax=Aestuariispira insulae TaxID=1461337 RepID=A0A3D9HMQ6_9PROT|nr:DNA polymerase Y family protein [Aestuariispira insulae]RED50774.1 protein ImuB [Aestuariispira insulae]